MSMSMSEEPASGRLPWLDKPVMLHSSREDTCKLTRDQCAYRAGHWRYWYEADHVYALNTVYFLCAAVGVFAILHFAARYAPASVKRNTAWRRGTALGRCLAYRGIRLPFLGYCSASLGASLLISVGVVFFLAMTLGPRPYYWPNTETVSYGDSQPIATRSGWMAIALLPFVLALGAKANLISALTGVPHEKLQVFHHWTSYAMFVLALVHTFPFIVNNIRKGQMEEQWRTSVFYWTGVAALIPQAYLTGMSLPAIRNRYYEFFKTTHFLVALLFLLFLFFHCDFTLSSWDYFIAGGAIYLLSLFTSLIRTHLINGRHKATIYLLPCGLLQIKIPTVLSWRAGQHTFIRFLDPRLGMHTLTTHPFTICSTPQSPKETQKAPEMTFYINPKRGLTGRLAKLAMSTPGFSQTVLLEGPYGGIASASVHNSDAVLIISGGSGGGFSFPVLGATLRAYKDAGDHKRAVHVVFATRSRDMAGWYQGEIEALISSYDVSTIDISVSIYVTATEEQDGAAGIRPPLHGEEKGSRAGEPAPPKTADECAGTIQRGRPNLPQLIAAGVVSDKRVGVFACGPASMLHDVRNAAAREQEKIVQGGSTGEVYLHTESFSW